MELFVEPPGEAIHEAAERIDEEADEAIIDKIAGGEAVHDNTAGAIVAISDKIAGGEAVRYKTAGEAILEAVEESRLYMWPPKKVEGPRIESRPQ